MQHPWIQKNAFTGENRIAQASEEDNDSDE